MAYFSEEQIKKAKEIDLLTYLQNFNPDELVIDSRNSFHTKTHDSLKISNGKWFWFSRGFGGVTALDYLIKVENYSFTDAVEKIINQKGEIKYYNNNELSEKNDNKTFKLPEKSLSNFTVRAYLHARGISLNIIDYCIENDYIYQENGKNNVVFVGYDSDHIARYAGIRATNLTRYMHDASGSDKSFSFKLVSNNNNSVHIFESAIDLLSYATLLELENIDWKRENLVSLAGIYNQIDSKIPNCLTKFLDENNPIDTIILHLDNDDAGRNSTKSIQKTLSDSYKIIDEPPKIGKDINDFLCEKLKINYKKNKEKCR